MAECAPPNTRELVSEIEVLRGALKYAAGVIRRLHRGQRLDTTAVLEKLALLNAEAKETVLEARKRERRSR